MKVSLIKSPANQNSVRGAGVYARELAAALKKIPDVGFSDKSPDLCHYLYFDPFFLTLPSLRTKKTIVTVFDLTPVVLADLYPRGVRGEIKWQIQKKLLKTVDHIITISRSAKNDIKNIVGVPEEKITVTYLAAGEKYKPLKINKEPFILYIGDVDPNKNLSGLVEAAAIIKKYPLVLVGSAFLDDNLPETRALKEKIKSLGIVELVSFPGYVDEEEKIRLLNRATVYCQPSIYEGFGLGVVEAMSCGTNVVCGDNSSLPEVAGDAAIYANVTNPRELADKLNEAMEADLREKSLAQAAKFSWDKTARETYEVYKKVLAR